MWLEVRLLLDLYLPGLFEDSLLQRRMLMGIDTFEYSQCDTAHFWKWVAMTSNHLNISSVWKLLVAIVRSHWEDRKRNVNNSSTSHAIVTQLTPIDWQWKCTYHTRNSASYNIGKYSKLKNHPLSKAYHHVVCVPAFVSAFCDVNSTWLLHDIGTTPQSIWSL